MHIWTVLLSKVATFTDRFIQNTYIPNFNGCYKKLMQFERWMCHNDICMLDFATWGHCCTMQTGGEGMEFVSGWVFPGTIYPWPVTTWHPSTALCPERCGSGLTYTSLYITRLGNMNKRRDWFLNTLCIICNKSPICGLRWTIVMGNDDIMTSCVIPVIYRLSQSHLLTVRIKSKQLTPTNRWPY